MKKLLVLALSCFITTAWAQDTQKEAQDKPAKSTDNSSLDGKTFRVTLTVNNDVRTSSTYRQSTTTTNKPAGTVQETTTPTGQSVYQQSGTTTQSGTVTQDQTNKTIMGTEQHSTVTTGTEQTGTGTVNSNTSGTVTNDRTETTGTVTTGTNTGTVTGTGTSTGNSGTGNTTYNSGTANTATSSTGVAPIDLNSKTLVITFDDGMLQSDKYGTAWEDENNTTGEQDMKSNKNDAGNGMNTDNTAHTPDNTSMANQEPFSNCPYTVTSGSGSMSTFSARCTDPSGNRAAAYWNGFVNGSTVNGNVIIYGTDGTSARYTFTGKATKNTMRKATSAR